VPYKLKVRYLVNNKIKTFICDKIMAGHGGDNGFIQSMEPPGPWLAFTDKKNRIKYKIRPRQLLDVTIIKS
jgi:hypothetical protein